MQKKVLRVILTVVLCFAGLLLLLSVLVYLPPVQGFIKDKVLSSVSKSTGMAVSVEKFRMRFPARVSLENTLLVKPDGDTLVSNRRADIRIALLPLLRSEVRARGVDLHGTALHYRDSLGGMDLVGRLERLVIPSVVAGLNNRNVLLSALDLEDGDVRLWTGPSNKPDTTAADTLGWKINAVKLNLERVSFRMETSPQVARLEASLVRGEMDDCDVDLLAQTVSAGSLDISHGYVIYLNDTLPPSEVVPLVADSVAVNLTAPKEDLPWTVNLAGAKIILDSLRYGSAGLKGTSQQGMFDPENIGVTGLELELDSLYNRGTDVSLTINRLRMRERSGLEITDTDGRFSMDSSKISIRSFNLKTPGSDISIDATADASVVDNDPTANIVLSIDSHIASGDIFAIYSPDPQLRRVIAGKTLTVEGRASGTLARLGFSNLHAAIPGNLDLTASGTLTGLGGGPPGGNIDFNATLTNAEFLTTFIADSALRNRVDIPDRVAIRGSAMIAGNTYAPDLVITADTGSLAVKGRINTTAELYDARIEARNFPVYLFLPHDSLGYATFDLTAEGNGFDFGADGTRADIDLEVDRFDYRSYLYHDLAVRALLDDHKLDGSVHSDSEALKADLDITGEIRPNIYTARISGRAGLINLQGLGFSENAIAGSLNIDASLGVYPDTTYTAAILLDSLFIQHGARTDYADTLSIQASASPDGVRLDVGSGDLSLVFTTPLPIDSLLPRFSTTSSVLQRQIAEKNIDMEQVQYALPSLKLDLKAGRDNIVRKVLSDAGYDFNKLHLSATTENAEPFRAGLVVNGLRTAGITLDTLNVWMRRDDRQLKYAVRLRNRPGNIEQMALIRVRGDIVDNTARAEFLQRNRQDSVGFRFGLNAELRDSMVHITMTPENPTFGYQPWTVNAGNYIDYYFNREIYADLRLEGDPGQHVYITPTSMNNIPQGAVHVDMTRIEVGPTLGLLPAPPPLDGILSANVDVGLDGDLIAVNGTLGVDSMSWNDKAVGDLGLRIVYEADSIRQRLVDGELSVDGSSVLTAKGTYATDRQGNITLAAQMVSFPLKAVNPFLPEDALSLTGELNGNLSVNGTMTDSDMDGQLRFSNSQATIPLTGTTFGISPNPIVISNGSVFFNEFSLTSPNNQTLTVDGVADISNLSAPTVDMDVYATDFEVINSQKSSGSQVYGKAVVDVDVTAQGRVDALSVRGDVGILNGTDVFYTLPQDDLSVQDQQQDIVTFVSFADTVMLAALDSIPQLSVWGMDMLVNVDIDEGVEATINLASDGSNRVELIGDGTLTFTMNSQGDSRFTGRYTLSGGTVVYNPPVISAKTFTVSDGSYVEWTGEIANPTFNVTAVESLSSTVTMEEGFTSNVTFDVTVYIRNTLENLELVFDLSANDLAIQNQLQSLAPEQRSQQALALLIYNTYTGPGTTAKVDANNPLNSFIEKQLNTWARNSLQNVDVSFGVKTVDDAAGGQHTDYSYRVSKSLFDDRIKVTVGGSINSDAGANENLQDNFVDDITLEYRLNRRDNMFLKAYRYNTQESILEGEVTETGFGFVARKKMNKLKELFRLRRSPEKKAARKNRREIKDRFREAERAAGIDPAKEQRQDDPLDPEQLQSPTTGQQLGTEPQNITEE